MSDALIESAGESDVQINERITALEADNERLRAALDAKEAREAALVAEREQAMAVVRAVATAGIESSALICGCNMYGWLPSASPVVWPLNQPVHHAPDCVFAQARALLASTGDDASPAKEEGSE